MSYKNASFVSDASGMRQPYSKRRGLFMYDLPYIFHPDTDDTIFKCGRIATFWFL